MMKLFRSDTTVQEKQALAALEAAVQDLKPEALAQDAPLQPAQEVTEPGASEEMLPEQVAADADAPAHHADADALAQPQTGPTHTARGEGFEAELSDVIRRDVVRWRGPEPVQPAGDNVSSLVQRVSGQSVREIDHVIGELLIVRDILREEGERLRRDLTGYASMNQAAMSSMKIIGDSMQQWRSTLTKVRRV